MEKATEEVIVKTELELAKELVEKSERELQEKAITMYNEVLKTIDQMGFIIEAKGQFQGNKFETVMVLVKKV